jgi:predicted permease
VALGANRSRLVRQLLTESVLLGLLGGAAGLLLATWTLALLEGINVPLPVPLGEVAVLEPRVLAYTIGLALLTGLIFGLVPALQASRTDVVGVLKNELVPSGRYRGLTMRKALVVSQVALSLVALIAAGLFLRSLRQAEAVEPGFETDRVLVMSFNLGREGYTPERGLLFYQEVAERTAGLPAVRSAAVAQNSPFTGGFSRSVFFEHDDTTTRDRVLIQRTAVTPGYFEAMGIPIVRGRDFTRQDRDGSVPVAIINETMADRFFAGPDPIGRRLKFFGDDHFTEIIGVARNSKYNQLIEEPIPFIYEALLQNYAPDASLIVRTGTDAATLVGPVREEVRRIDPSLAVFNAQPLRVQVEGTLAPQRVQVTLLSVFGLLALVLAAVGIYGVTSYAVSQRTREIGVRMALGARRGDVLRLVLGQGLLLVGLGLAIGFGAAWAVSLLAANLLFNVSATDPATFVGTALALGLVALAASYLPALRATRVDPLLALRSE